MQNSVLTPFHNKQQILNVQILCSSIILYNQYTWKLSTKGLYYNPPITIKNPYSKIPNIMVGAWYVTPVVYSVEGLVKRGTNNDIAVKSVMKNEWMKQRQFFVARILPILFHVIFKFNTSKTSVYKVIFNTNMCKTFV